MRKSLLTLALLGTLGFGGKVFAQSSESIPKAVKSKATEYLMTYALDYCDTLPRLDIIKVGEKTGDFNGDGFSDKVTLYEIKNVCEWSNVPNEIAYVKQGTSQGYQRSRVEGIISRDKNDKAIPLKDEDWPKPEWFD